MSPCWSGILGGLAWLLLVFQVNTISHWEFSFICKGTVVPTEEKINCLRNEFLLCSFHRWGGLVFIMGDHDNFPSWRMIRYFSHWVRDFLSLS